MSFLQILLMHILVELLSCCFVWEAVATGWVFTKINKSDITPFIKKLLHGLLLLTARRREVQTYLRFPGLCISINVLSCLTVSTEA